MGLDVNLYEPRPIGPTAEVYPQKRFTYVVVNVPAGASAVVLPYVLGGAPFPGEQWPLIPRNILSYELSFGTGTMGGRLEVQFSYNGVAFLRNKSFPLRPVAVSVGEGIYIPGWSMRMYIWNNDPGAAHLAIGTIITEAM